MAESPTSPAVQRSRPLQRLKAALPWGALWLLCALAAAIVYRRYLNDSLIYDDLAMVLETPHYSHTALSNIFAPQTNGFIRPWSVLQCSLLWHWAGPNPLPYHVSCLLSHTLVATIAGWAAHVLFGASRALIIVTALAVTLSASALPAAYMVSNGSDLLLALFSLIAITQWQRWLQTSRPAHLITALAALALALTSKETALALGPILLLQTFIQPSPRPYISAESRSMESNARSRWIALSAVFVLCAACASALLYFQSRVPNSYTRTGFADTSPTAGLNRLLTFTAGLLTPAGFTMQANWTTTPWNPVLQFTAQTLAALILIAAAATLTIATTRRVVGRIAGCKERSDAAPGKPPPKQPYPGGVQEPTPTPTPTAAFLIIAAAFLLWPVLIVNLPTPAEEQQPGSRYAYASAILLIIAIAGLIHTTIRRATPRFRPIITTLTVLLTLAWLTLQVHTIKHSPTPRRLHETARQWENLHHEIQALIPTWPPLVILTLYTGPTHGSILLRSNYGQALLRFYFPGHLLGYHSNQIHPTTTHIYTFNGKHLLKR